MDLRHLRYFVAIAEYGTVSRAAARLNTTQPSLSRQIHDLEEGLGVALFERVGRRLHLTGAGEDLLWKARQVLNEAEEFRERARSYRHGEIGVLRVGATPQSIERLFPPLLDRFRRVKPGVTVKLTEGDTQSLTQEPGNGGLHLVLTAYQPEWRNSAKVLGTVPIVAVSGTPLPTDRDRIDIADLENRQLLVFRRGFGNRDLFDAACRMAHITPSIYLESNAPRTLLALARSGWGTAILPATVAPPEGDLNSYVLVQDESPLELQFAVHWNPQRYLPPYGKEFIDELEAVVGEAFSRTAGAWAVRPPKSK